MLNYIKKKKKNMSSLKANIMFQLMQWYMYVLVVVLREGNHVSNYWFIINVLKGYIYYLNFPEQNFQKICDKRSYITFQYDRRNDYD